MAKIIFCYRYVCNLLFIYEQEADNSVTFFGLINKYFLTIFYFIAHAHRRQEFLALFYTFKWSLFAKCIVLY